MREIDYGEISKGVRELVRLLNEAGFETTDSGDGTHHLEGMEGAPPFPMVAIIVEPWLATFRSHQLMSLLMSNGLDKSKLTFNGEPSIMLTYSPSESDRLAMIMLLNILDSDLDFGRG